MVSPAAGLERRDSVITAETYQGTAPYGNCTGLRVARSTYILHKPVEWVWFAMISGGAVSMMVGVLWLRLALRRAERMPRVELPDETPESVMEGTG